MTEPVIDITEIKQIIDIETTIGNDSDIIEITNSDNKIVEIVTGFTASVVYAGDIIGLDNYISNFIDSHTIDCGTP